MRSVRTTFIGAAICVACSSAGAAGGVFQVTNAASAGSPIDNITEARQLLNGQIAHKAMVNTTSAVINYNDPEAPGGGFHFGNKSAFPVNTPATDWYAALHATGTVIIPTAGNYTFGVNSDDGFDLTVGSFNMNFLTGRTAGDSLHTFAFATAGNYAIDLTYFQGTGQSQVELFASPGSFSTFGAAGSNFQLIGGTATGALQLAAPAVPEPTTLSLVALAALPLLKRRRE